MNKKWTELKECCATLLHPLFCSLVFFLLFLHLETSFFLVNQMLRWNFGDQKIKCLQKKLKILISMNLTHFNRAFQQKLIMNSSCWKRLLPFQFLSFDLSGFLKI